MKLIVLSPNFTKYPNSFDMGRSPLSEEQKRKASETNVDKFNFDLLEGFLEGNKGKITKIITGLNYELNPSTITPYFWILCLSEIARKHGIKLSIVTENAPHKFLFLPFVDEMIVWVPSHIWPNQFSHDLISSCNFSKDKVRVVFPKIKEENKLAFQIFDGKITVHKENMDGFKIEPSNNVRLISFKWDEYMLYYPNGDIESFKKP